MRRPCIVAQRLALAHHIETLIRQGKVRDRAAAAKRLGLSRSRMTLMLDLTLLAPDIQEEILFAEAVDGREPIRESDARAAARHLDWSTQRAVWRARTQKTAPRAMDRRAQP